jgi:hypothetical protein
MNNPFTRPQTLGQWLLGSICWIGSGVSGTYLLTRVVDELLRGLNGLGSAVPTLVFLSSAYFTIFLVWRRVMVGSSTVLAHIPRNGAFFWASWGLIIWRLLIGLVLVISLLGLIFYSLALLVDVFDHEPIGDYF